MVTKFVEAIPGETWVLVAEMPNGLLRLEGIREDISDPGSYYGAQILFSKDAIKTLIPILIKWIKERREDYD